VIGHSAGAIYAALVEELDLRFKAHPERKVEVITLAAA